MEAKQCLFDKEQESAATCYFNSSLELTDHRIVAREELGRIPEGQGAGLIIGEQYTS